ncbi:zf-HC2 domain-containing protein [Kingella negevensis]|uniref:Putative zinc-finger domain-containing protein n=1 Tax=Kingella negevensis TaxID=1522312 RepID=A0A238HF76_9NEIS|nr:zf-HC2 domain-containing protein [Kingella negevensis]MDK4680122.1 zf-HC2 domain-containing protein [Kingella negevensis]MDK4682158.1 zf-HC2 domain-containing protein [Kingella negevensis]MDK4685033.1 zf-HC2 domain-containing protein [Kingella negevensis]MDK4689643.1 zf-HC2 domain-containing protein [Kingella negevensis]MDK4690355.1 zf-HC2 domain-containing protein [Kingella negevensis]
MKKCRKATVLISKQHDKLPLDAKEKLFLQTHLLVCPHCRAYKQQIDVIEKAIKKLF